MSSNVNEVLKNPKSAPAKFQAEANRKSLAKGDNEEGEIEVKVKEGEGLIILCPSVC
jgi:hypothetical protein